MQKILLIKERLRNHPFHTFLIGLYFIIFIFLRNINELNFPMTFRSILVNFILTGIFFGCSYLFFKSTRKAGIFSTLLLLGFFTYGVLYNQLEQMFYKGSWPLSHIHRYLLITYSVFYLCLFIILHRSRRPHYTVNYILNVSLLVIFLMNISFTLFSFSNKNKHLYKENPFLSAVQQNHFNTTVNDHSPDIYYIILDGYASEKTLTEFYSDTNPSLYNFLREKGFYIADSSRANYPYTAVSLSSSLNLNYLNAASKESDELIHRNLLSYLFRKNNYRVVNIESGYAVTSSLEFADKTIRINSLNEFENKLLELTMLRLDDVLGFSHYMRLKSELNQLKLFTKEKGPKFSFVHIVCPHPPYVVDSNGVRKINRSLSDMAWEPRKNYLQQLKYVSKKVMDFINSILADSKTPPIIVLQSDHGPWINDKDPKNVYDARTRILNAYYVPGSLKNKLYPTISPVNSFRLIFSDVFNTNYPLLPDLPVNSSELSKDVLFQKYND